MNVDKPFTPHPVEWNEENTNRLWNFYSSLPAMEKKYFGARVGRHVARTLKRLGLLSSVRRVVDFSCGTGSLIAACVPLLPNGARIAGLDPSPRSVEATVARNRGAGAFDGAQVIDGMPSALPSDGADLVLLTEVIEHLSDDRLDEVLAECGRILAPGGRLFVTTPNGEDLDTERTICPECGCTFHRWQHVRSWTAVSLASQLKASGFGSVDTREIAWGNELIDLGFTLFGRKKTGILAVATKP
ncbi:MAG: class I SAM-dependent methyltransferase [Rhodocyclaceae bacterium]|nr:class I SAM-dependent methyltransferase [Rhodocyclaceae bacterium]